MLILKVVFTSVFQSDKINYFVKFHSLMRQKWSKCRFVISSTYRSDKAGAHSWSIFNLHPRKEIFLFDSFGLSDLKSIITQYDEKLKNKILFSLEKFKITSDKLTLKKKSFPKINFKKWTKIESIKVITTARHIFQFIEEFMKFNNVLDKIYVCLLKDRL